MPNVYQDLQANQNQPEDNAPNNEPSAEPNTSTQQQAAPNTPAEPTTPPQEDIVSRASSFVLDDDGSNVEPNQSDVLADAGFNRNEWNAMLEQLPPEQKQQLEAAYKSLQRGADSKFQKAADMLKQAEALQQQPWTLERVQQLTQDPAFVQAAQQYQQLTHGNDNPQNSGLSDEEYSNLSDVERQKFIELTQNQQVLQSQLNDMLLSQQDEKLQQRYRNYDSSAVKGLRQQLLKGEVQATSEHLWKVLDYDSAVQRAYKLGLQDRQLEVGQKMEATPVGGNGTQFTPSGDAPVKQQGENTISFFKRLAEYNKKRVQQSQGRR